MNGDVWTWRVGVEEHMDVAWRRESLPSGRNASEISILKSQIRGLASIGVKIDSSAGGSAKFHKWNAFASRKRNCVAESGKN